MSAGEGKGWAKGKTASGDGRVARNAERHRGMTYERHLAPDEDKRHRYGSSRTLPLEWSDTMAYVVGLMATDGCLYNNGRHLSFGSSDRELVETLLECLGRRNHYQTLTTRRGTPYFRAQFGDTLFYRWLQGAGLTPRKSLTLGALSVPDTLVFPAARGLLDGDGSILRFTYDGGGKAAGRRYEALVTRFISASETHVRWLRSKLTATLGITGSIARPPDGGGCWQLNYAIEESSRLLPSLYPSVSVPKLDRKWRIWLAYAREHGYPATLEERISEATAPYERDLVA